MSDPTLNAMIYGIDPEDLDSYINTNLQIGASQTLPLSTVKQKIFQQFITDDPYFNHLTDENGVPPYRVHEWTIDGNNTIRMRFLDSSSPLLRRASLHSSTTLKYNLTRYNLPYDVVVFAFYGQKAYTVQYRQLMDNYEKIYQPNKPVGDLLKMVGTAMKIFSPALAAVPGAPALLSPIMNNVSSAMLGQRIYSRSRY